MTHFLSGMMPAGLGAFLAQLEFPLEQVRTDYHRIANHPRWVLLGCVLVLLLVLWWVWRRCCRRCQPLEVFTNQSGKVSVSRHALGDLVESAALQFGVASRPKVSFEKRGGMVHLHIRLKLTSGQRLPVFSSGLQTHLADTLRDALGLENLGGIHLTITAYKGSPLSGDGDELKPLGRSTTPKPSVAPRPDTDFFESQ